MKNLIRKDFIITYINKFVFYLLLFLIPFFLFLTDNFNASMAFLYSVLTFSFIATRTPFSYEVRDEPHLFIQSLPVTKTDIVISKYISIFINFLIGSIFTILYLFILSRFTSLDMKDLTLGTIALTLVSSIGLVCISLPAEFMFTTQVANFVNIIIYVIFFNFFIVGDYSIIKFIDKFYDYRVGIALLTIIVYFLSMASSIVLYKNRNFT